MREGSMSDHAEDVGGVIVEPGDTIPTSADADVVAAPRGRRQARRAEPTDEEGRSRCRDQAPKSGSSTAPPAAGPRSTPGRRSSPASPRAARRRSAVKVASAPDYETKFGPRSGGSLLYDAVAAFFAEGGGTLYVARAAGAGAVAGDRATRRRLRADTRRPPRPASWGNTVKVTAVAPAFGTGVEISVENPAGTEVDRSPGARAPTTRSSRGRKAATGSRSRSSATTLPTAAATVTLTTGADGSAPGTAEVAAALARFEYGLGPGQVAAPGYTTTVDPYRGCSSTSTRSAVSRCSTCPTRRPAATVVAGRAGARDRQGRALRAGARAVALLPGPGRRARHRAATRACRRR